MKATPTRQFAPPRVTINGIRTTGDQHALAVGSEGIITMKSVHGKLTNMVIIETTEDFVIIDFDGKLSTI